MLDILNKALLGSETTILFCLSTLLKAIYSMKPRVDLNGLPMLEILNKALFEQLGFSNKNLVLPF